MPGVPRGFTAHAVGTLLTASWDAPVGGGMPSAYAIQIGSAPGRSDLGVVTIGGTLTSAAAPAPNGTFYLRAVAVNQCGASDSSDEAVVAIGQPNVTAPFAPVGLLAAVAGPPRASDVDGAGDWRTGGALHHRGVRSCRQTACDIRYRQRVNDVHTRCGGSRRLRRSNSRGQRRRYRWRVRSHSSGGAMNTSPMI